MEVYYKMREILLQNVTIILLQNATKGYYKMRQLLQNVPFITYWDSTVTMLLFD